MNEPTRLLLGSGRTVLRRRATTHELRFGVEAIARSFGGARPTPLELERTIELVEDELARVPRPLHGPGTLVCDDARLAAWAAGAALLSREEVEALFQRLASAALGDPSAWRGLPGGRDAAAALLAVRETMHHLGYGELRIPAAA